MADKEVFLSQQINEKVISDVKTERQTKEDVAVYKIKEIRDREANQEFLRSFMNRMEGKK